MIDVVAVDRADIVEAELLEQRPAGDEAAGVFLGAARRILERLREMARHFLGDVAQRHEGFRGKQARQIGAHRADRRRDRHVVVVEDDDQPRIHRAGIVHRLIGHPPAHRAVADHGDDVAALAAEIAGDRHAERGGDRGRGVRRAERVVFAFRAFGETGKPAALANRADAVAAAGQDLVRIRLVADIPDQPVVRRVEDVMQRHGQLDDAEAGAEMSAGDRHRIDQLGTQLVGELPQIFLAQLAQIGGNIDLVEQRRPIGNRACWF